MERRPWELVTESISQLAVSGEWKNLIIVACPYQSEALLMARQVFLSYMK